MAVEDWSDPGYTLRAALTVLRAPLDQTLQRLSEVLADLLPHRAVAMLTGDCAQYPFMTHGDPALTDNFTAAELTRLAGLVDVGQPWFGEATVAGAPRPVLAVASAPPVSAGSMLAVVPTGDTTPTALQRSLVQQLWDLTTVHIVDLLSEAVPVYLAENRAAAPQCSATVSNSTEGSRASTSCRCGGTATRSPGPSSALD
jgi:hypothetical protein